MKSFFRSCLVAFSEYSISPKSSLERKKENCDWVLVWLPIIGLIITVIINRWAVLYPYMCDFQILPAIVGAVVPVVLSGGYHLKGFFKTVDAISSHKSKEEKIRILSTDYHGGYAAITVCSCLLLFAIGIWSEMPIDGIFVIAFSYIISRSLAGISLLTMKHATKSKATAYIPDSKAVRIVQVIINIGYIIVCIVLMYDIALSFNKPRVCYFSLLGAFLAFVYYCFTAKKNFGGVSEETANYFIVVCEVVIPVLALVAFKSPI